MEPFNFPPLSSTHRNWLSAPPVVKGWAYQLSWLAIAISILGIVVVPFSGDGPLSERVGGVLFYAVLLAFFVWLNRGLKNDVPAAWTAQIIVSTLGLLAFPLGTLIHGYILRQWFQEGTRKWFD